MSVRKRLPIGIQTFAKIREDDCYYVDKTPLILRLVDEGSHYFLSRPRRFGKSLLLDTIAELFEGKRALFEGLHAQQHWDWSQTYPVIRISLAAGVPRDRAALERSLREKLLNRHRGRRLAAPLPHHLGYLSLASIARQDGQMEYGLRYPNREAETSLQALFTAFFASIPNDWYRSNPIAQYEGYYASVFYSHLAALGLDIQLEDVTNKGCIDMTVLFNSHVYLFEFKVVELVPEGRALQQIKDRGYADKYRARGETIHLIGVEFSREQRRVVGFEAETR